MRILLRPHLKIRLKERKIPRNYPSKIISQPEIKCYDTLRNHYIAVKKLKYNEKPKPMVTVYDIIGDEIQIISIYPTSYQEIENRLKSGRWVEK